MISRSHIVCLAIGYGLGVLLTLAIIATRRITSPLRRSTMTRQQSTVLRHARRIHPYIAEEAAKEQADAMNVHDEIAAEFSLLSLCAFLVGIVVAVGGTLASIFGGTQ